MKKATNFFIVLCLIISVFQIGRTQTNLRIIDCNTLEASFVSPTNKGMAEREFLLEKELIAGVWHKITERKGKEPVMLFNNLPTGTYRVSVVTGGENITKTKIHVKGSNGGISGSNVFISNKIELTKDVEPCDEIMDKNIASRRSQYKTYQERLSQFELFPNPANTSLNIRFPKKENINHAKIAIQDINGQELVKQTLFSASQELSIAHLEEGVYFVKIEIEGELTVFKKLLVMR